MKLMTQQIEKKIPPLYHHEKTGDDVLVKHRWDHHKNMHIRTMSGLRTDVATEFHTHFPFSQKLQIFQFSNISTHYQLNYNSLGKHCGRIWDAQSSKLGSWEITQKRKLPVSH
jgi:hypothetical protein